MSALLQISFTQKLSHFKKQLTCLPFVPLGYLSSVLVICDCSLQHDY